jgi:hypothetical protein
MCPTGGENHIDRLSEWRYTIEGMGQDDIKRQKKKFPLDGPFGGNFFEVFRMIS